LATGAYADFAIDSDFDSGSIGSYTIDNDANEIEFTLVSDGLSYTYWTNFKVSGVLGEEVTFRITNANQVPFLIGLNDDNDPEEAQMVYRCDGENWDRLINHGYVGGTYSFWETFTCDVAQIATFFPFSYTKMSDFVDSVSSSQWAEKDFLGFSEQRRDINLLTITNTEIPIEDKKIVYIIGRQHAAETTSSHMLEGMINFLISDDINACGLRNNFVWYIVPMVNPDGVCVGNSRATSEGVDPNRDWHPDNHDSVEIDIVRTHIQSINAYPGPGIDFFIDWHSQMDDDKWYNFLYSPEDNTFFSILSGWTNFNSQSAPDATSCSSTYCTCRGYINTYVLLDPADPTFVFEPTPHLVSWTIDSLNAEGINTAFAIGEYFDMSFIEPDLGTFAEEFGRTDCAGDCLGDFNGDDDVDGTDFAAYSADFANMCP
jgi:zinc carboxypeptidase/carboxypeptidase M14-like protein